MKPAELAGVIASGVVIAVSLYVLWLERPSAQDRADELLRPRVDERGAEEARGGYRPRRGRRFPVEAPPMPADAATSARPRLPH